MRFVIECERENDGRWLAEVPKIPGVMVYGKSRSVVLAKVEALALRAIAERLENSEDKPQPISICFATA